MADLAERKPLALANWKMAMTVAESLAYVQELRTLAADVLDEVDVVICPPFTAIWALAQALPGSHLELGAQNQAAVNDPAYTGQVSAALLADAGCRWVMLGHWEVRRYQGDDDSLVNRKIHLALQAGLHPILLVGESAQEYQPLEGVLADRLERLLADCQPDDAEQMVFLYEPEAAIGASGPLSPEGAALGCGLIRNWLATRFGHLTAQKIRIIYGGSVSPAHAAGLLACPDVDGLGAGRKGRAPGSFAQIVRTIAQVKHSVNGFS